MLPACAGRREQVADECVWRADQTTEHAGLRHGCGPHSGSDPELRRDLCHNCGMHFLVAHVREVSLSCVSVFFLRQFFKSTFSGFPGNCQEYLVFCRRPEIPASTPVPEIPASTPRPAVFEPPCGPWNWCMSFHVLMTSTLSNSIPVLKFSIC